jgi:hypothetical protein
MANTLREMMGTYDEETNKKMAEYYKSDHFVKLMESAGKSGESLIKRFRDAEKYDSKIASEPMTL